jgi:hypothetical protein
MVPRKSSIIDFSSPEELSFEQHPLELVHHNRSQAFPDLAKWNGRFYLAFRTAPSHFPSTKAHLQIFTSENGDIWRSEHVLDHIHDVRDPHFLVFRGELNLFFMSHSHGFRHHGPETISTMKKTKEGWTEPMELPVRKSGFWDVKASDGKVYMSAYSRNGEEERKPRRQFRFLSSSDLEHWKTLITSPITRQTLGSYETSEASFAFDPQGRIVGTIRSLIYPNLNFSFRTDQPEDWQIAVDRFKCDGPRLFSHNGEYYLAARRSLFYGLRSEPYQFFPGLRNLVNIARYSFSRKRTALYHFDKEKLQISHITDLPSHGDTGYSAVAHLAGNRYLMVYYSSDIRSGKDVSWARGQLGETKLYSTILTFR